MEALAVCRIFVRELSRRTHSMSFQNIELEISVDRGLHAVRHKVAVPGVAPAEFPGLGIRYHDGINIGKFESNDPEGYVINHLPTGLVVVDSIPTLIFAVFICHSLCSRWNWDFSATTEGLPNGGAIERVVKRVKGTLKRMVYGENRELDVCFAPVPDAIGSRSPRVLFSGKLPRRALSLE